MTEPADIDAKGGWQASADGKGESPLGAGRTSDPEPLGSGSRFRLKSGSAIVPRESVSGEALLVVVSIMAFLACLCVGGVVIIADMASGWQREVSREVTIQIQPADKAEMDDAMRKASRLVLKFDGISKVTALDDASAARLLEPWLGSNLDLSELPVPRLLTITVKDGAKPDFEAIRKALAKEVPGAYLDDHQAWLDRLARMAWAMVAFGTGILSLVLAANVMVVIFATRAAMAESRNIIDVLHFVGATPGYVAGQFQRHILTLAMRGAIAGGVMAVLVFAGLGVWSAWSRATPAGDQISALFGSFSLGWRGFAGIAAVAVLVPLLAAVTSRLTVLAHLRGLEVYSQRR